MICPHCRKEIEQQPIILANLNLANGCNPPPNPLVLNVAPAANALNPEGQLWTNTVCAAGAAQPGVITYIEF